MFSSIEKTNQKAGRDTSHTDRRQTDRRLERTCGSWFDRPLTRIGHDLDGKRRIECERLPAPLRRADARTVECVGSLDSAALIDHITASGAVTLVAPDGCANCPLGGSAEPPGQAVRATTAALLIEMGLGALAPVLKQESIGTLAQDDSAARRRSRRGFLRRLSGASRALPTTSNPVVTRKATLDALRGLATAFEVDLPPQFFPALRVGDGCAGHRVCVASCASKALVGYEVDGVRGVEFDAELCTACGHCVERCPEQALTLKANGNGTVPTGALRLSAHAVHVCARCEDEFTGDGDDALCPGCRKDIGLFNDLATAGRGGATEYEEIKTEVTT